MKYEITLVIEKTEDCFLIHSEKFGIWSAGINIPELFFNFSKDLQYVSSIGGDLYLKLKEDEQEAKKESSKEEIQK